MDDTPLRLKADWNFEEAGERRHYLVEAWLAGRCVGRAHGWFERGAQFVLEKIEIDRDRRSQGHGSAVIRELRTKARQMDCSEFVIKGVRRANEGAIRLYESLGAVPVPTPGELCSFVIAPP